MIESDHRKQHWQGTKTNAFFAIGVHIVFLMLASVLGGLFASWTVLGFPFAFYFSAQGAYIVMIIIVYWSFGRQKKTDRLHGASEEI